jgi:hypothetical protein
MQKEKLPIGSCIDAVADFKINKLAADRYKDSADLEALGNCVECLHVKDVEHVLCKIGRLNSLSPNSTFRHRLVAARHLYV